MNLGCICNHLRRFDQSFAYHERACKQFENTIGNARVDTADAQFQVARHCLREGDLERAE